MREVSVGRKFYPELEGVRGLAAFTVLIEHWVSFQRIKMPLFDWLHLITLDASNIAVLVFFVLSGFVLTNALYVDGHDSAPGVVFRFWLHRIFRIWPLAIVVILAAFVIFGAIDRYYISLSRWGKYNDFSARELIHNLLLISSSLNTPGWTLKYELGGYALIPLGFLSVSLKGAAKFCAFALLVFSYYLVWLMLPSDWLMFSTGFVAGFVAFHASREIGHERLSNVAVGALFLIAVVGFVLTGQDYYSRTPAVVVAIAALFLLVLHRSGGISAFLQSPPVRWLGRVSFSIYLLHYPIMWFTGAALTGGRVDTPDVGKWLLIGLAGIAGTLLLAPLSYRYVESPARNVGRKIAERLPV